MKKILLIAGAWLAVGFTAFGQSLYVYPSTVTAPRGSTQTVTAIINGVADKTVTWTTDGGTLRGTNPCVVNEPCTIGLYSATPGTYHVTATSNANGAVTQVSTITLTASPTPVTDHPRFLVTSSMLSGIRAKAVAGNPMYQALLTTANTAYTTDSAFWTFDTWSGSACTGGSGPSSDQSGNYRENDAWSMAQISVADSSSSVRNQYGCAARTVFMTNVGYVISGAIPVGSGNRWSDSVESFMFTADYLMAGGYLSSSDITLVRQYLSIFGQQQVTNPGGNGANAVIGSYNTPTQFDTSNIFSMTGMTAMGSNYTYSRVLVLAVVGLTFNDNTTDDPPLANTCSATRYVVCPDGTAGSLHAYWTYDTGGMLYKTWADMDDPNVVQQAYNAAYSNLPSIPNCTVGWGTMPCFGQGQGAESREGAFYSYSRQRATWLFNAVHTSGNDDPLLYGPQMSWATSSYTDLLYLSDYESLVARSAAGATDRSRWAVTGDGDILSYDTYPNNHVYIAGLLAYDSYTGRTDRKNALEWLILNLPFGGPKGTIGSCGTYCGLVAELGNSYASQTAWELMIALPGSDPTDSVPPDPRSTLPTDWYAQGNRHLTLHDNWIDGYDYFTAYFTDTFIDHEHQMAGEWDINDGGDYITKHRQIFNDYNVWATYAPVVNVVSIVNSTGTAYPPTYFPWGPTSSAGGQFWHGFQNGLNALKHFESPTYAAMILNNTGSYNGSTGGFAAYNDVTGASRSTIFLRSDKQLVYYDRASVAHSASTQKLNVNTTGIPTISGNTASWTTRTGARKAFYTSLMGGSLSTVPLIVNYTITAPHSNLQTGTTMQVACISNYADGTTANCNSVAAPTTGLLATYSSDNSAIASVSSSGLITAVGIGTTNISAMYAFNGETGDTAYFPVTVVPGSSSGSSSASSDNDLAGDWEPALTLAVTPSGTPTSNTYLSVLQWGATSMTPATTSLVSSTSGQGFDGALVGSSLLMFMRNLASFTGVTYPASGATTDYVADLSPNTTYTISGAGAPGSATTDTAGVLTFICTGTGNITIGSGGTPTASTPTFSPPGSTYTSVQSVTLSTSSAGAIICYNTTGAPATNGTTGCTTGTLYSGAITVSTSETIYAVAGGTGWLDSSIGTAVYTINIPSAPASTLSGNISATGKIE